MNSKSISRLLSTVTILILLLGFSGCSLIDNGLEVDEGAERRLKEDTPANTASKPTDFTATVKLFQDYESVKTLHMGQSNHNRTVEETLLTLFDPISSGWGLLDGKKVQMSNVTNYNLDELTGAISGSNHSTINIIDEGKVILTLSANGTIEGNFFTGANIQMNWVTSESKGSSPVKARGKITGTFYWVNIKDTTDFSNPVYHKPPYGVFELTGTYN